MSICRYHFKAPAPGNTDATSVDKLGFSKILSIWPSAWNTVGTLTKQQWSTGASYVDGQSGLGTTIESGGDYGKLDSTFGQHCLRRGSSTSAPASGVNTDIVLTNLLIIQGKPDTWLFM